MHKLSIALKKQKRQIERLKHVHILACAGFGKNAILCFNVYGVDSCEMMAAMQTMIDTGHYKSVEDFDSYNTADIEFSHLYYGRKRDKYQNKTMTNLVELGKFWRDRVSSEYPGAQITIAVHKDDGIWFLDTFNYPINLEDCIYI